jgi:hypothetical protein
VDPTPARSHSARAGAIGSRRWLALMHRIGRCELAAYEINDAFFDEFGRRRET